MYVYYNSKHTICETSSTSSIFNLGNPSQCIIQFDLKLLKIPSKIQTIFVTLRSFIQIGLYIFDHTI